MADNGVYRTFTNGAAALLKGDLVITPAAAVVSTGVTVEPFGGAMKSLRTTTTLRLSKSDLPSRQPARQTIRSRSCSTRKSLAFSQHNRPAVMAAQGKPNVFR